MMTATQLDNGVKMTSGQFLYFSPKVPGQNITLEVTSPRFKPPTKRSCALVFSTHMYNMDHGYFKMLMKAGNHTLESPSFSGDSKHTWETHRPLVGRQSQPFNVILEFIVSSTAVPSHIAISDIKMESCYEGTIFKKECQPRHFVCSDLVCIDEFRVCDLTEDCVNGEDEEQYCDQLPESAYCTFEGDTCGWTVNGWKRVQGSYQKGPAVDHTFKNSSGSYMITKFPNGQPFVTKSFMRSPVFEAPPYYHINPQSQYFNSCTVRFFYHHGRNVGELSLQSIPEEGEFKGKPQELWRKYGNQGNFWWQASVPIINITTRYYLQFTATKSMGRDNIAIDDISLSPKCFGKGVPPNETHPPLENFVSSTPAESEDELLSFEVNIFEDGGTYPVIRVLYTDDGGNCHPRFTSCSVPSYYQKYSYTTATLCQSDKNSNSPLYKLIHSPHTQALKLTSSQEYEFTTCGAKGRLGPSEPMCNLAYNNTATGVVMATEGTQKWTVPYDGLYTVIVRGAGGGGGLDNTQESLGSMIRATFTWTTGDIIYILVGQRGVSACTEENSRYTKAMCDSQSSRRMKRNIGDLKRIQLKLQNGGGGGGGGASVVYKIDNNVSIPLIIAAGGGGISAEAPFNNSDAIDPNGKGVNTSIAPGNGYSGSRSGGGGGWNDTTSKSPSAGKSIMEGGHGGDVCKIAAGVWETQGGFGGGGGGCASGGGGGGYRGGDAAIYENNQTNGEGGVSFLIADALNPLVIPGSNEGDGSVTIIPAQIGCGCEHLCVALDVEMKEHFCICPVGHTISDDEYSCNGTPVKLEEDITVSQVVIMVLGIIIAIAIVTSFGLLGLMKYRKSQVRDLTQENLNNPSEQLTRLREGGMVTEYNPNYEFGGSTCTAQDLREVPREQLTLVKALGQGAFGEVYQGYLTNPNDNSERPVAVKTLPELSASQAEMDFLMEALIMSKFNHPNIVSFIGVCFEKLPKFIILELLPGGDLKSFLRECRPKPQKPSPLTVTDLLTLAMHVAKGCQYLEENHFIHRDIAARNCLLTTKEAERVVKIADFGMARDIYRADYYRKGGKAMLPVKWMPPEAFLDGIFTSKTDVWSFGVLLWEVISLGYMPYPGRGNQEVMQLVTSGGRLEPPTNCPNPVYHIMMQCWHPLPDERPTFATILERLGYCLQDPDVFNAPLPVFNRAPSMERDATVMRPADADNGDCLRVQRPDPCLLSPGSEDYLIPMPQSTYSITTERTDLQSSPSMGSVDQLLELEDRGSAVQTPSSIPSTWETNFMTPDTPMDGPSAQWNDLNNPINRSPNTKHSNPANFNNNLKKRSGGYRELPTEDVELPNHPGGQTAAKKISPASQKQLDRNSSIKSLEDLPVAPIVINANEASGDQIKTPRPMTNNHSNLSLDPSALARQLGQNMPRRYMNVDVNFNTGDGSGTSPISSRSETSPYDQNTANRNVGPYDGYAGVNPVA